MKRFALLSGIVISIALAAVSCSKMDGDGFMRGDYSPSEAGLDAADGSGGASAGVVTAGEWNDLDNWMFWSNLMLSPASEDQNGYKVDLAGMCDYWGFYTNNRVAVLVQDSNQNPARGVKVSLNRNGAPVWSTYTDNAGRADCWVSLFQKDTGVDNASLSIFLDDKQVAGNPVVSKWNAEQKETMNVYTVATVPTAKKLADVAFIVDATGSMGDEINFLKKDLLDILDRTAQTQSDVTFRTSALFYRDKGDNYVTKVSDFSTKASTTIEFIKKQNAGGGGDYPEAVHTALETGLQKLSWSEVPCAKLAFMLLDAPAHHEDAIIKSLQKSVESYAAQGIKLIPVAASGVDKNTEFMLRFFSIPTGGTYVFITNDSGVGNDHIAATVGEYQVEHLNDLMVRLINKYTE